MQFLKLTCFWVIAGVLLAGGLDLASGPAWTQEAFGEQSVLVGGVKRSFVVHMPANLPHPAPVVVVFHGAGGGPESIARNTGMDALADQNGFIAVYPAGTARTSGRGGVWNIGGPYSPTSTDDVAFVRAILRDLERFAPIDNNRIYAAGFSMGGMFTYRLACEMSETFAAIASVAGTMVEPSCRPSRPVAVLHIHGTNDDRIPINGGRGEMTAAGRSWPAPQQGVSFWSRIDACGGQPTRSDDGCLSYGQCRAAIKYCVVAGGGHAWPSGASERIWAFFATNPKQAR